MKTILRELEDVFEDEVLEKIEEIPYCDNSYAKEMEMHDFALFLVKLYLKSKED